jgi:hypothetical protein
MINKSEPVLATLPRIDMVFFTIFLFMLCV